MKLIKWFYNLPIPVLFIVTILVLVSFCSLVSSENEGPKICGISIPDGDSGVDIGIRQVNHIDSRYDNDGDRIASNITVNCLDGLGDENDEGKFTTKAALVYAQSYALTCKVENIGWFSTAGIVQCELK